ncbi:hypothetical protein [Pseudomonas abieticivorans]|nr:hypothetical protein [Pseudomonas sp. PIA16]
MFRLNKNKWLEALVFSMPVTLLLSSVALAASTDVFLPLLSLLYVFIWL